MNKIPNNERVSKICMKPIAYTKCRIGQDWFLNEFEAVFFPDRFYPDYIEVEKFIAENIEGKEMNIEETARCLCNFLMKYDPKEVYVIDHIRNCKTHFCVDVTVE